MAQRQNSKAILLAVLMAAVVSANLVKRQTSQLTWPPAGVPGVDYPTYDSVPPGLKFTCDGQIAGYYADPEAQCQVWHWCLPTGQMYSFLCPNQTMFNQNHRVCDWWYNVKCDQSASLYSINDDLYKDADGKAI